MHDGGKREGKKARRWVFDEQVEEKSQILD